MSKRLLTPTASAIYDVAHLMDIDEDEEGFVFMSTIDLVAENGHRLTIGAKVWDQLGRPKRVKITLRPADA